MILNRILNWINFEQNSNIELNQFGYQTGLAPQNIISCANLDRFVLLLIFWQSCRWPDCAYCMLLSYPLSPHSTEQWATPPTSLWKQGGQTSLVFASAKLLFGARQLPMTSLSANEACNPTSWSPASTSAFSLEQRTLNART